LSINNDGEDGMTTALEIVRGDVYEVARSYFMELCDDPKVFEREAGFAIQVLSNNDYALKVATENRQSVINAVTNIAAIGISLNPAKRQAYLVPRDGRICLDISYMGLLDLAVDSGSIRWGQAELVYSNDEFMLDGIDKQPIHRRKPFASDRGDLIGAYVVVKTADGDYLTTAMSIGEVFDIRDRSSAWKAWVEKKRKCPWVTDEGEMVKKTVIKRAYKTWPRTDRMSRLENAVHYLNTEAGEGLHELEPPEKKGPGVHRPTDGMMSSLSIEAQDYVRQVAEDVIEAFQSVKGGAAAAFERVEIEGFDNDTKVALWSVLPSDVRSALKKEAKARQEQAKQSEGAPQ
jgi:recombination protein RecT